MSQKPTLSEKLGMHPQLAIGYLGLLLFMIGDGVESGFLSSYLLDEVLASRHRRHLVENLATRKRSKGRKCAIATVHERLLIGA